MGKIRRTSDFKFGPNEHPWRGSEDICLYGWDSRSETWHGPNELGRGILPDKRLLQALRGAPGRSWYGQVKCGTPDEPATRFFALMHDLSDCAIA